MLGAIALARSTTYGLTSAVKNLRSKSIRRVLHQGNGRYQVGLRQLQVCAYRMAENTAGQVPPHGGYGAAGAGAEAPPQKSAKQLKKDAKKGAKLAKYNEKMSKLQEVRSHINYR